MEEQEIAHGETRTKADGTFDIVFTALPDKKVRKELDPVFDFKIIADITDLNGETRTAETIVSVGYKSLQLQISLAQFPQNWRSPPLTPTSVNEHLRNGLSLNQDSYSGFERFIRERIWEMIPVCFLEGYSDLTRQIECLSWPRAPKFIFTSNNFDTDEVFKAYAAHHSEKGVPYFVGQHGNGYGTHRSNEQLPDLVSSDKFFSWGWTRPNSNVVPAFALSKIAGKKIKYDKAGILLLIEGNHPPRIELWDTTFNFSVYQEDQFVFVNTLPEAIRRRLVVRMFPTIGDRLWSPTQRWKDRLPKVHIQFKRVPMATMFKRSCITVHSFDSTSILESLSSNIPTVCFWRGGLEHLSPHAREDYERLREVGILTETAESAANHVAAHWDDVDAWWLGDQLQIARKTFCEKYARTNSRPIRTLRKLLTSA